jgi:hypothetical protein
MQTFSSTGAGIQPRVSDLINQIEQPMTQPIKHSLDHDALVFGNGARRQLGEQPTFLRTSDTPLQQDLVHQIF